MTECIPVFKDEEEEQPIPTLWRDTLYEIAEAFKGGDFQLQQRVTAVDPPSTSNAQRIGDNIRNYGDRLVSLPDTAWKTSICRWQRGYWQVLVDLFTENEGASDLVLFVRVYEYACAYRFEIESVHVP